MNMIKKAKSSAANWWMYELVGVLSIIVALLLIANPAAGYSALVIYFSILFLLSGVFRLINSMSFNGVFTHSGWHTFVGALDIFIGAFLLFRPDLGAAALPFFLGFILIFSGLSLMFFGSDTKSLNLPGSGWVVGVGVLCAILGVVVLAKPVFGAGLALAWAAVGFLAIGIFNIYVGAKVKKLGDNFGRGGSEIRA